MNARMAITVYVTLFLLVLSAVTSNANSNHKTKERIVDSGQHYRYSSEPSTREGVYGTDDHRRTILNANDYSTMRSYLPEYQWRGHNYNVLKDGYRWNSDDYNGWSRDGRYYPWTRDFNSWYYNNPWRRNYNYNRWNSHNYARWNADVDNYYNSYPRYRDGSVYSRNFFGTGFRCPDSGVGGYYADVNSGCQIYHICQEDGRQDSFSCANGTLFNQKLFTCDFWYNVDCGSSTSFYYLNERVRTFPRLPVTLNRYE